jgi:hypothetical protein
MIFIRDYRTIDRDSRGILPEESYREVIAGDGYIRLKK